MTTQEQAELNAAGKAPVCARCGSDWVVTNAWASWNMETRRWDLEKSFDQAFCQACEAETTLTWITPEQPPKRRVRELNDAFRIGGEGGGSVMITEGVSALGPGFVTRAVAAVRRFDKFSEDNDPWGEHDFGAIALDGEKLFWKIDAYDRDLRMGSPNPADPAVTHRVLTIMLASEY